MTLYNALLKKYGYNEPILTNEIQFKSYSKPWLYKELNKLCEEDKVKRFEKGVYYIPKKTPLGDSVLDPSKVVEKKYIKADDEIFGYYSGYYLLNVLGLTNQVPNVVDIYSNNESSKLREITVGSQNIRVRRARVDITKENVDVLTFLELMNIVDSSALDETQKRRITKFLTDAKISRGDITKYAPFYPDKAMRAMIESEMIYSVTQQ